MRLNMCLGAVTLVTILLSGGCGSVASADQSSEDLPLTQVTDFYRNSISYSGEQVRIRGYIFQSHTPLWFLRNSFEDGYKPETPFVLVKRSAQRLLPDNTEVDPAFKCTGNYVELTGIAGQLPHGERVGVTEIETITVFKDKEFSDAGIVCFDSTFM